MRRDFVVTNVAAEFLAALLSPTHAVFALFFFHGLYETTCVMNCAHVLLGLSLAPMLHQKATEKLLQEGLETAERWPGSKVFPYPWIPDGVVIWKELTACQRLASLSSSTFVQIDKTMPVEGASSYGSLGYMRRHVARNIHELLNPCSELGPADWALCCDGMGTGPREAAQKLDIDSFQEGERLRRTLAEVHQGPYNWTT